MQEPKIKIEELKCEFCRKNIVLGMKAVFATQPNNIRLTIHASCVRDFKDKWARIEARSD